MINSTVNLQYSASNDKMHPNNDAINHKFILIIDGSWFLKSRVSVLGKNPDIDLSYADGCDEQRIHNAIIAKLTTDLSAELHRMQHFVSDVIIAVDDKKVDLWRSTHEFLKMPGLEEPVSTDAGYKGTRQYDKQINWLKVYSAYFQWLDKMWTCLNVRNVKIASAEADDVIYMLATIAMQNGRNVLWHGTDKDLTQICSSNPTTGAIGIYAMIKNGNKSNNWAKSRLIACDDYAYKKLLSQQTTKVAQPSIFDEMNGAQIKPAKNEYEAILQYADLAYVEHAPSFLWYKILLGDSGDNVPEVFANMKKRGKNNAHISIGDIYDTLQSMNIETDNAKKLEPGKRYMCYNDIYNPVIIEQFLTLLYKRFMKVSDDEQVPADKLKWLIDRFAENRLLMALNSNEIPRYIIDDLIHKATFIDWSMSYANMNVLCNYQETLQKIGINSIATADLQANAVDAQFAKTFVNGLFS